MKKIILCAIAFVFYGVVSGQITNEKPKSFDLELKNSIPVVEMPSFDLKKLQKEDAINDLQVKPYRFGYEFEVDLGPENSGVWDELPNGDKVWRLNVHSKGANTINFIFDSFELLEGEEVFLYNHDKSFVLGAYTSKMNNENKSLGTWIADGDMITVEYYVPSSVKGKGKFHIGSVVHGYRTVSNFEAHQKRLNDSGNCNLDVNCSIGSDFDGIKDKLKKGVALILNGGSDWCSGTLINNTSNNKAPYLLTANHCSGSEANWSFRFNWISTNTVCATSTNSIDNGPSNYYQVTGGATVLAKNQESDFNLIRITGGLDDAWDLEWAGWDRTDNFPTYVVGIHHPSGDIMKVCRDDSPVTKVRQNAGGSSPQAETWDITTVGSGWDQGVTEGGSSGSALYDQNGRVIGQLYGGTAACSGTNDNGQHDYYGRFATSWDFGTTNSTRLSNWLDPTNTGKMTLEMLSQEILLNVDDVDLKEENIVFYPNPSNGILNVANNTSNKLTYKVFNIAGQNIGSGEIVQENDTVDISSSANGIYFISVTNETNNSSFSRKIIKQ
ncbi:T9SS type A sorting domain-containing protein [Aquimarina sp. 2201CG14-23]|uniref:T9SS type A sorting domain-containing protein n=1 Tax=Aquimarina mycalae TaxID=3040073 RepID=UPI002477DB08|nr:T9SS type A sorting domain-containing protein [Aquimarina sp. 2201CG14-23]MDH7447695.1 T9SS type A sorting domain-containing protein [Aquimarina sp. 2201CG14-23]